MYQIKNFKTFRGHEGEPCAQGTLHGPAGKVAEWSDDSHGGDMHVHFTSATEEAKFTTWAKTYLATRKDFDGELFKVDTLHASYLIESALHEISYELEERKEIERHCKKGIAYFRRDAKAADGKALFVWKAPYTAAHVAMLKAKHSADLLEICNERLGLPFVDADLYAKKKENEKYRKLCKSVTVFTLRQADGTLQTMQSNQPFSSAVKSALSAKYPNVAEFVNERYL
jgi:hypothetical protein